MVVTDYEISIANPVVVVRLKKSGRDTWATYPSTGGWLALALEFQLGADVVQTTISREASDLIALGAVAVVRTFLNYFLSLELQEKKQTT